MESWKSVSRVEYERVYGPAGSVREWLSPVHSRAASFLIKGRCSTVLDVGCGDGYLAQLLSSVGIAWVGVDFIDYASATRTEQVGAPESRVVGDGQRLPFKDSRFGGLCALGVACFIAKPQLASFFRECARVLEKGGLFILRTNVPLNKIGNVLRKALKGGRGSVANYYTRNEYVSAVTRAGLSPVRVFYSLDSPVGLSWEGMRNALKYPLFPFLCCLWIVGRKI
jgi:SAM-dependent methyltransferase